MSAFVPSSPAVADKTVANDGWYPDLTTQAMQAETGQDDVPGPDRIAGAIRAAMIETNIVLTSWRAGQTAATLADVSARRYGDTSEKVFLYRTAVYTRARAELLSVTRDYDTTRDGHDRADALEKTADDWLRQSNEALSRLMDRPRAVVELI